MSEVVAQSLTNEQARSLTDRIKGRAEELWSMLLEAYEGGAHTALGYSSWGAYFNAEFGGSKSRAYQLLDAGRVVHAIDTHSRILERPNAGQADVLAPLAKSSPEEAAEVWSEVIEVYGEDLTALDLTEAVGKKADEKRILAQLPSDFVEILQDLEHAGCTRVVNDDAERQRLYEIFSEDGIEAAKEVAEVIAGDDKPDIRSVFAAQKYLKNKHRKDEREAKNDQEVADVEEEAKDPNGIREIVRAKVVELVVEFNDGNRHAVAKNVVLGQGYKNCPHCKGHSVVERHQDQS